MCGCARKVFRQRMCMGFLFLDGEFSATALLSETARIKNTYTDGIKLYACRIKYIPTHIGTKFQKYNLQKDGTAYAP